MKKNEFRIRDRIKTFEDGGISKYISPEETFRIALKRILNMKKPILAWYSEIQHQSQIPHYIFWGTKHLRQYNGKIECFFSQGKGHSKAQALASGIMELIERYSCCKYIAYHNKNILGIASFKDLKGNLFNLESFYSSLLPQNFDFIERSNVYNAKLSWYRAYTLKGKEVLLPLTSIVYFNGTNGMAAGNCLEEAILHGICEVIERHCLSLIDINRIVTPVINISSINNPIARELINRFQALNNQVIVRDFSLGIGLPVIGVVRKVNKTDCIVTVGVSTNPARALVRALAENSQIECKKNYRRVSDCKYYFIQSNELKMAELPDISDRNIKIELERIEEILKVKNMKVFFVDTTDQELNIPCVIVVISRAKFLNTRSKHTLALWLIRESLEIDNYRAAKIYIKQGKKIDKKNFAYYLHAEAVVFEREKNYFRAVKLLHQILIENKNLSQELLASILFHLGLCYYALNKAKKTVDYFARLIETFPDYYPDKFREYYLFRKNRSFFKNVIEFYNELKVAKQLVQGAFQDLKRTFIEYLNNKKNFLRYFKKAEMLFKNGQYKKAIVEAEKAMRLNNIAGKIYSLNLFLGRCYIKIKQFEKAVIELNKAKQNNVDKFQISNLLAYCYKNLGQLELMEKELRDVDKQLKRSRDILHFLAG